MGVQGRSAVVAGPNRNILSSGLNRSEVHLQSGGLSAGSGGSSNFSTSASGNAQGNRQDVVYLTPQNPVDGIVFARIRHMNHLTVFRTPEMRAKNPERINLDRRLLESCPHLEHEGKLRLLNYQNNSIRRIENLENLPNLIFLDLYNNRLDSLEGSLATAKGLRVFMAGKNRISTISNLSKLTKLDVLDLHSNEITEINHLQGLSDLRVLNLAGNLITLVQNMSGLQSLTELNLRRNNIESVDGLHELHALQRVFLSHNRIRHIRSISCLLEVKFLIELSLDGNPVAEYDILVRNILCASFHCL
jgi:leucine-rich repeat-containing protein 49